MTRLHNATVKVKEWKGDVVFLHEVIAGSADHSYGIQVAKLAGLPARVIERAKLVLAKLEQEDRAAPKGFEDLPLFAAPYQPPQQLQDDAYALMIAAVAALNPDEMSPREAMEALYALKQKLARRRRKINNKLRSLPRKRKSNDGSHSKKCGLWVPACAGTKGRGGLYRPAGYSRRYSPVNVTVAPPQPELSSTMSQAPMRCMRTRHSPPSFSNGALPSSTKAMVSFPGVT